MQHGEPTCENGQNEKRKSIIPRLYRVLAFGDSLTEGYYNYGRSVHPYSKNLQDLVDHHFPNTFEIVALGVPGEVHLARSVFHSSENGRDG